MISRDLFVNISWTYIKPAVLSDVSHVNKELRKMVGVIPITDWTQTMHSVTFELVLFGLVCT